MAVQLVWGATAVGLSTIAGLMLVIITVAAIGSPAEAVRVFVYATGGVTALVLVLYGLGFALVHSWFSRNANWAIPALIPALALSLPWVGGLLHTVYLGSGFGIPADAIQVSVYWSYAASLKPVGVAIGIAVLWLALAGWLRHYYWWVRVRAMVGVGVPLMSLLVVGVSLAAGLAGADMAAARAKAAAASGENPAPYYGVNGRLVCVKPMGKETAVFNGPLAIDRPLVTFGLSGDRVWLWEPLRAKSLSVRLEDVVVTQAEAGECG